MTRPFLFALAAVMAFAGVAHAQPKLTPAEIDAIVKENQRLKAENKRLIDASRAGGRASSATAVVDLKHTYDSLKAKVSIEADFKTREEKFKADNEVRETKLKQLQDSLTSLKSGTVAYVNAQEQLEKEVGDYKVWVAIETGKINRDRAAWIKMIYGKMLESISEAAAERGYDLVLFKAPTIDFTEVSAEQVPGMIQSRKVLWSIEELDLTDLVIQKMNLKYDRENKGK
jgi:Skp family chaperone for outer membrane proteins